MELLLRLFGVFQAIINYLMRPILYILYDGFKQTDHIPPIKSSLLTISAVDLAEKIRNKEVKSEEVIRQYIDRIKAVNPFLNAVGEDRFEDAIKEAVKADKMCSDMSLIHLVKNYPLLGVPFTVKESCGLKGLPQYAGSVSRFAKGFRAQKDGVVVERLRAAGAIPLLVSNTPEFCMSWESYNHVNGRVLNPYHSGRTSGGSSGGEGALLGCGASLFGVGSDIAGSIRVPSHFNGIFGHKPTAGIVSVEGHFPSSSDKNFNKYLVLGPMCRYAKDLPTLTYLMCEEQYRDRLKLDHQIHTSTIKIYYLENSNGFGLWGVNRCIQNKILEAVSHFKSNGLHVEVPEWDMSEILEISVTMFFAMDDVPDIFMFQDKTKPTDLISEIFKSMVGRSQFTFAALYFNLLNTSKGLMPAHRTEYYMKKGQELKQLIQNKLSTDGVLFYPTHPQSAFRHLESYTKMSGVMYTMIFNLMGFPSCHVPLGKDKNGLPIGMQVVAAPYQDRLCFAIARELEAAFGGWSFDNKN